MEGPQLQNISCQTDHEVHDVFYYKTRAYKAEIALLTLRRDQYIYQLRVKLKEREQDTTNKLTLYSYSDTKTSQLKQEFQNQTILTDQLETKARDIFTFNIHALNDGHELNDLPLIEDSAIDLNTFRLGPVTPTIPSSGRQPHPLLMHNLAHAAAGAASAAGGMDGATDSGADGYSIGFGPSQREAAGRASSLINGFSSPTSYIFPRVTTQEATNHSSLSGFSAPPGSMNHVFNMPLNRSASPIGSNRPPEHVPLTAQFNDIDINGARGEEILRMISLDGPSSSSHTLETNAAETNHSSAGGGGSSTKPPDVIPKTATTSSRPDRFSPTHISSQQQSELAISGAMGLDHLEFDYPAVDGRKTGHQKWSHIAAGDVALEGDWQAVGSKKPRPPSAYHTRPLSSLNMPFNPPVNGSESSNFEQMVVAVQEKYQLTRPEVIAVLQVVRNERNGDMNISLNELMKDAERLLSKNKNVLKPASLTARARAVPDHEEPCDNQLCPARLKLLKYRTELCLSYQTTGKCHMKPGSCVYAHGVAEQRPLPKQELCERYLEGKCNNKRCVYAHGALELKNKPLVNPVEYLKSKMRRPPNENHRNGANPANPESFTLTEADRDPRGEECVICLDKMSKKSRRKLDCGHDTFHYKCLRKWVDGEGDRSCPLCRSNTLLPEEYPRLGAH